VALGLATVAVGSDGGGSIRIPSAFNGIFGIKPTFGRIGRGGSLFGCSSVSHFGPLAASVADCVDLLVETARGVDPVDPATRYATDRDTVAEAWLQALGRGVRGCRIGIPRSAMAAAEAPVRDACFEALDALETEGAVLVDLEIPLIDQALAVGVLSIATETMASLLEDYERYSARMGLDLQLLLALVGRASAKEYLTARRTRPKIRAALAQSISTVDVLAFPTTCALAPRYPLKETQVSVADDVANQDACRLNFLGNLTGLPAGSVPVGLHEGLPIGLQIMGDAWDEASVIAVMTHCERLGLAGLPLPEAWTSLLA
jgi:aspartyl-tRNA(Asn)/glutamyl-tRNA(Gln) amidotransferase subunit A